MTLFHHAVFKRQLCHLIEKTHRHLSTLAELLEKLHRFSGASCSTAELQKIQGALESAATELAQLLSHTIVTEKSASSLSSSVPASENDGKFAKK